jgi:hypothetical protein
MTKYTLSITNERLWKFYDENKHISFEAINIIFHEVIAKLVENMSATMQSTINSEILACVHKNDFQMNELREKLLAITDNSSQKQSTQMNELKDKLLGIADNISQVKRDTQTIGLQCSQISDLKTQLQTLSHNISELKTDITNNISVRFIDFKNEYMSGIKSVLTENQHNDKTELFMLIEKMNSTFIDKTKLLLSETIVDINAHNKHISNLIDGNNHNLIDKTKLLLVDNQDKYIQQVDNLLNRFQNTISDELKQLVTTDDNSDIKNFIGSFDDKYSSILQTSHQPIYNIVQSSEERIHFNIQAVKEFINSFDTKCAAMFQSVQSPVFSFLSASEERIQSNLLAIKENNLTTHTKNAATMDELSTYLKKFNNSSIKGMIGETELENVLTQMFPSGEVVNTSGTKASCDFLLRRSNKPNIMLENKVYHRNVDPLEVDKFIRDVDEMKTNAVFLSQYSGISRKNNFQIDLHKGCVLVYIHNVEYSREKIQMAIDIIDNLSERIQELDSEEEHENIISKALLDEINQEYIEFNRQRDEIILSSKDYQKRLISQLENLKINALNKYLSTKYSSNEKTGYTCEYCNMYTCKTKKSLSAHVRACKKQHEISVETDA